MSPRARRPLRQVAPPAPGDRLCRLDDLDPENGTLGLEWFEGDGPRRLVLARRGEVVHAYVNECPHALARLDTPPGNFLSADGRTFRCNFHGARFTIRDGRCFAGPCVGQSLRAVPIRVAAGEVRLAEPARPALRGRHPRRRRATG